MQNLGKIFSLIAVAAAAAALAGCALQSAPRAQFSASPEFGYPPLEVTFDGGESRSPNGAIVAYDWDFGDGETSSGDEVTHTYTDKGVYAVTLEVTDEVGRTGARTKSVEALNKAPVARFKTNVNTSAVEQPIWFNASESYDPDGEIVQYIWNFGDGTTAEGELVDHEYLTANGNGWRPQITLTVVDENGASDTATGQLLIVGCDSCGG
jgi:PKD repeat protein